MAFHNDSNVYIPLCGNAVCEKRLEDIAQLVKKCTTKHEIFGSYIKWFKQHFEGHLFTIIHQCPTLWQKIRFFKDQLNKEENKLILLTLDFDDIKEQTYKCSQQDKENVVNFFIEFGSEHNVSNDQQVLEFAEKVNECVRREYGENTLALDEGYGGTIESGSTEYKPPSSCSSFYNTTTDPEMMEEEDDNQTDSQVFVKFPDIFGETDHQQVSVKGCLITEFKFNQIYQPGKSLMIGQLILDLNKDQTKDKVMSNNKFILLKTLPEIFDKRDLPALASVCSCRYPIIQKRALVLLELAVWRGMMSTPELELKYLTNAESLLAQVLKSLKEDYVNSSRNVVYLALLERASNVYIMILSAIIMCCRHGKEAVVKCNSYLDTMRSRKLCSPSKSKDKVTECFSKLNRCLKESKDFVKVKDKVMSMLAKVAEKENIISKCAQDLAGKSLIERVVVTFEMLKKVFEIDPKSLIFLHKYLGTFKGKLLGKSESEAICVVMVFRALTLFLKYQIHQIAHMDLHDLCQRVLGVLEVASHRELPNEVWRSLHSLLFHPHSEVRRGILKILDEKKKYTLTFLQYIQDEVVRIVDPLLTFNDRGKMTDIIFKAKDWKTFSCKFGSENAVLCFHFMNEKDYSKDIKIALENHEDINYNEMYHLIHLQHKNIVQLFAFQRMQVPVFYIMEDCSQNLQVVMRNYRDNGKYLSHLQLCHFLLEAVSALQYCHDHEYIHRNLTAHSLAFIQNKSVKLCSFGLCTKLEQKLIDPGNQKNIPFRWSAPESLFHSEYTKLSDIWMVGILIYEVMTHGILPFSALKYSDSMLYVKMKNSLRLNSERCIDDDMSQLITDCTSFEQESRPYIENVKTRIEEIIEKANQNPRTTDQYPYPKFDKEDRISSTLFNRGLPFAARSQSFDNEIDKEVNSKHLDKVDVSEILRRIKGKKGNYLFSEKVIHKMPPLMLSLLKSEQLKMILTHLHTIKIYQTRNSVQYLVSNIPPSDPLLVLAMNDKLESLQQLLDIIFQVASMIAKIASMDLVLGDIFASAVYVEQRDPKKVHILSLAFMKKPVNDCYQAYDENQPQIPQFMFSRAAPELIQENNFTKETDVYCFGNFMWEILTAFDLGKTSAYVNLKPSISTTPFGNLSNDQLRDAVLGNEWEANNPCPSCCPDKIYQLIKTCVNGLKAERPTMRHVVIKLKEYCKELFSINLTEVATNSNEASQDISWGGPGSSVASLTVCNPSSTHSDSDTCSGSDWGTMFSEDSDDILQEVNPSEYSEEYSLNSYTCVDYSTFYVPQSQPLGSVYAIEEDEYETPMPPHTDSVWHTKLEDQGSEEEEEIYCTVDEDKPPLPASRCPPKPNLSPKPIFQKPIPPPKPKKK